MKKQILILQHCCRLRRFRHKATAKAVRNCMSKEVRICSNMAAANLRSPTARV
ncbi:MAG: hypothetical protein SOZ00_07450 [Tidjanibacter sp.]|nr:hypothetical protein [Tidjanibacter sp.]